jgi:hypothetical protein
MRSSADHIARERGTEIEKRTPRRRTVLEQINAIEARVEAGADCAVAVGQVAEHAAQQQAWFLRARRRVARQELRAEQPAALGPGADQRLVGQLALIVDPGAWLVPLVDLDPGRVEVQRHPTVGAAAELTVHGVRAGRKRGLGRAQVRAPEAPRQLIRSRRRRDLGDRTQLGARLVGPQPFQVEHRVAAAQHRLGDRDQQLPGRAAAGALNDCRARPVPDGSR